MRQQKIFLGTELKLNVNIEPMGTLTMDGYNFEVEFFTAQQRDKKKVFKKGDAGIKKVDSNNYICCLDTADVGVGALMCRTIAYLPDGDFEDGLRTEIVEFNTKIEIVSKA